ncbi:hypothetical protein [Flavobacterium sp. LC2016-01]|uniref:hypothetical protein n=1 Tax=Flavobacterium sp. LC2016-01 TaxID=2675876 RepID=UPI0012BA971F|nr:hypothetical protein [Flavobacterium sp. LC2016-01]MTH14030.1 hypothetical protein [Flavobacterium sp. LC2016-01]
MKNIILLITVLFLCACSSSKNSGDKWVGKSKQNLIKSWGTPIRTFDNTTDGEILVYADQVYEKDKDHDSRMAGPLYWNYIYIYVNKAGKIVSFRNEKQNYPPQSIDSDKLAGMNLLTVK